MPGTGEACLTLHAVAVGRDTAPLREVIKDDETGRMVGFFDTPTLVDEISELPDDAEACAELGRNARL